MILLLSGLALAGDQQFVGICDASGAAWIDGGLWVANDEDSSIYHYTLAGEPQGLSPLGSGRELDLEGAATSSEGVWWVGSLGNNKDGEPRPERGLLIETRSAEAIGQHDLRAVLMADPALAAAVPAVAWGLPPKEGGVSAEGLAADIGGGLWLGLRSPLNSAGHATLVRLEVSGAAPTVAAVQSLDLGGRGVRDFLYQPESQSWLVLAGPTGGGGDFALYRWAGPGTSPTPLAVDLSGLNAEALVMLPDGQLLVISDDGGEEREGEDCKDRLKQDPGDPLVYFRARTLALPR